MTHSVDDLRTELKRLGYLSHGLERWFARDPWRSGTFWAELLMVASKASLVIGFFAAAAGTSVMISRNAGLPPLESITIFGLYFSAAFLLGLALHFVVAFGLKAKPGFGIENPRRLMVIAMGLSGTIALALVAWWTAFPTEPAMSEVLTFLALLLICFLVSSIVISAALLSFSIHETHEIPTIHRRSRTVPLLIGVLLLAVIMGQVFRSNRPQQEVAAQQVVVRPSDSRIAFIAVDGLTPELFELRPELQHDFRKVTVAPEPEGSSAPEVWATIGTGTPPPLHRVRSVEGVRLAGRERVMQSLSPLDYPLRLVAPAIGIAERQPLPPSVRDRHYVWEILAERGIPSLAINWWTSEDRAGGALMSVSQESIFRRAASEGIDPVGLAIRVDATAIETLESAATDRDFRFLTIYLPALDVITNRISSTERERLAATIQALDQITMLVRHLGESGWNVVLVGTAGDSEGKSVIATNLDLASNDLRLDDIAPTLLALYGFPASTEMTGEPLAPAAERISSYGSRESRETTPVSDDYYENLKSLGYIQ